MKTLWTEAYRPATLDNYVWVDDEMRAIVEKWLADGALPHLLLSGLPGTGKTSLAKLLFKLLGIPAADLLYINASRERQIDAFQARIVNFVDAWAMGPSGIKYILLDECLHEDESIRLADGGSIALKDMRDFETYSVVSLNMGTGEIEEDTAMVISRKDDEVFEVTLEDGRTIRSTIDHPFLIRDMEGNITVRILRDLHEGDAILGLCKTDQTIRNIRSIGRHTVVNLAVSRNHTFITTAGIPVHNCDKMSPLAQNYLRNEMETYSDVCRFILTANHPSKVIPPIHSRVQELRFPSLDRESFTIRLAEVLEAEKIQYQPEILLSYVDETYPDLRKCLGLAQQNTRDGKLWASKKNENNMQDYLVTALELFRTGRFLEGRKVILANIQPEEYDEFYRTLYQNLSLFGKSQEQQDEALQIIRRALVYHESVADAEINAAGCLVELAQLSKV